ncbi:hypothetical protein C9374_008127 [Naegleria lovaniensis]|uniref:Uncharacterized protein n=1 Tax=Naegleria lovaniensis TaxID=51637 RepID=A0AA88GLQ0_NAELO|nr:uncharacterized protein C9374_008127 [Naegleria lovaniensis]KAG2378488.1 hypothetical protein C9374_008127 [Naegleria lovaniensis]
MKHNPIMDPSPSKCCCGNNISSTPIQPKKAFASIETRTSESNSEEEMHRNDGIPMNSIAASSSQCTRQSSPPSSLKPPPRILLDESDDNFSWVPQQPVTSTTTFSPKKTQHHSNSTAHPTSPTSTTNTILNSNLSPLKLSNQKHKSQNNVMTTNCSSSSSYHHTSILNTTLSNDISARMNEKTTNNNNNNNTDGTITHPSHIPRSPASKEKRRKIKSAPASVKRNSGNERNSSRGIFSAIKELLTMCKGRSNHVQPNNSSMIEGDTTMTSEPKETSHDTNNEKKEDSVNNTNQHTQTVPANHRTDSSSGLFHRTESNHSGDSSVVQLHDSSMNPFEKQSEKTEVEVFDSNQPPSSPSKVNNRKARCGAHASSSDFIRSSAQPVPLYFFVLNGQQQQQQQPQGSSSSFSPKKAIADNLLYDLTPPTTTGTTNETTE